jgi:hypothetical protein
MTHMSHEDPRVATIHEVIKESGRVLPRPSAIFHTRTSTGNLWAAQTLSHMASVKRGKVSSNMKLLSLQDFIYPVCASI